MTTRNESLETHLTRITTAQTHSHYNQFKTLEYYDIASEQPSRVARPTQPPLIQ